MRITPEEHLKKLVDKQNRNADVNQFEEESGSAEAEKEVRTCLKMLLDEGRLQEHNQDEKQ